MPKTILITGSSTGIGRATALHFANAGWNVAATMRAPEQADASLAHPNITKLKLDVTQDDSIAQAIAQTTARYGSIDVLLNNAGYGLTGALEAMTIEQFDRQLQTNVYGIFRTLKQIIPLMRQNGGGLIINISSIGGRMAFPFFAPYHASKFAVEGLSESLRFELKKHRIRVKVVEPGGIATDFISRSMETVGHPAYQDQIDNFNRLAAGNTKHFAKPEQVAAVIYQAATDGSQRLRYYAKAGPFPFLHSLLPDILWRKMLEIAISFTSSSSK